jgi:hypothetical protein
MPATMKYKTAVNTGVVTALTAFGGEFKVKVEPKTPKGAAINIDSKGVDGSGNGFWEWTVQVTEADCASDKVTKVTIPDYNLAVAANAAETEHAMTAWTIEPTKCQNTYKY